MVNIYKNKQFIIILFTKTLNTFFSNFFIFTIPILIYELTTSVLAMSTMRAIEFIPNLLLAIFIGVFVDRYRRKNLLVFSTFSQAFCILIFLILLNFELLNIYILYILSFIIFTTIYIKGSAQHSIIPNIVEKKYLSIANSKFTFYDTISGIIAPTLAGFFYTTYGAIFNIKIYFIGTLLVLFLYFLINIKEDVKKSDKSMKRDIMEGWHELTQNRELWKLTIIILFVNLSSSVSGAVLTFFALDSIQITELELGYIFTGSAIGALIGSQLINVFEKVFKKGTVFIFSYIILFLSYILLFFSHHWLMMFFALLLIGLAVTLNNIQYLSLRQASTPNHLLGRVAGTSSMIMKLSSPLAFLIAGFIGELIDVRYLFLFSIAIMIFIFIYSINKKILEIR